MANNNGKNLIIRLLIATAALFLFGVGVYFTIQADLGAAPWDVFYIGMSKTLHILYGTVSIGVSAVILLIDILMKEPIGIAMIIDAVIVGKTVDLCNYLGFILPPEKIIGKLILILAGLILMGYAQYFYMSCALGCGPRDTLLIGLKKRITKIPIGVISACILTVVTFAGWLLGGKVGIGTLICAFLTGPIMQIAFKTMKFEPTLVEHQDIIQTFRTVFKKN